ncbi:hypothetical protein NDI56_20905 [Haloarcula sp. S1CR25-12]|uniref:Uncharacterized protein n=1 Tax=Haloarcula saliterrae TaxID=2950534 RepID=A0ABU2FHY0_9EURY|nr:hypothetical protein [Haloarcula sp. S1CR25-12]MDS0261868.1 hypothetical protein [Haloarcula sp. S1CR25-12]
MVSNEDIFLFKLIAGRDDDIADMNILVQAGLDYDVVRAELDAQIDWLNDDQFATFANGALVDLEEQYGVTTPIEDRVQELTDRYYRGLEVLQTLDGPMTVDELATELGLDIDVVRNRVTYLAEFGRVRHDGEIVRPIE